MNFEPIKETFHELFSHLEAMETQSFALMLFLKDRKHVTDRELAPYLEQAGNTSNVKWRATRLRMQRLFELAEQDEENAAKKRKAAKKANASRNLVNFMEKSGRKESGEKRDGEQQVASADSEGETRQAGGTQEKTRRVG